MFDLQSEYRKLVRQPLIWVGVMIALFLLAELSFDVVERAIGQYLVWQNPYRQKVGRSWQEDQNRLVASTRLETLTRVTRERVSAVESIKDFEQLVQYARSNPRTILPLAQFSEVYHSLPEIFRPLIVAPSELIVYRQKWNLTNALLVSYPNRLEIFLLNADNQTIHRAALTDDLIDMISNHGKERLLDIRSEERFATHIFAAEEFLRIVDQLFYDDREVLIRWLPILTDLDKKFVRVAFSNYITEGFVETAFVLDDSRAVIYYLPEEWTIDLISQYRRREDRFRE